MTQPPPGGYPPPEQTPPGGQPGPAGPAAPSAGAGYPPDPGQAPAGPPPGYAPPAGGYPPPPPGAPGYPPPPPGQPGYPPPGGYQQPGQPAYAGAPGSAQFDISKVTIGDWIIMGTGLLLLIFSFFGWLSISLGMFGSYSVGAWHEYWWIATILGLAVAVIVALRATMGQKIDQIKPQYLMFGAAAGFLITLIALIEIFARFEGAGPGFGIWACLILSAAQTYFVWLWAQRQPGWTLPKLPGPANF